MILKLPYLWPSGTSVQLASDFFWQNLGSRLIASLPSGITRCSRLILCIFCPRPRSGYFSKVPVSFYWEMVLTAAELIDPSMVPRYLGSLPLLTIGSPFSFSVYTHSCVIKCLHSFHEDIFGIHLSLLTFT